MIPSKAAISGACAALPGLGSASVCARAVVAASASGGVAVRPVAGSGAASVGGTAKVPSPWEAVNTGVSPPKSGLGSAAPACGIGDACGPLTVTAASASGGVAVRQASGSEAAAVSSTAMIPSKAAISGCCAASSELGSAVPCRGFGDASGLLAAVTSASGGIAVPPASGSGTAAVSSTAMVPSKAAISGWRSASSEFGSAAPGCGIGDSWGTPVVVASASGGGAVRPVAGSGTGPVGGSDGVPGSQPVLAGPAAVDGSVSRSIAVDKMFTCWPAESKVLFPCVGAGRSGARHRSPTTCHRVLAPKFGAWTVNFCQSLRVRPRYAAGSRRGRPRGRALV